MYLFHGTEFYQHYWFDLSGAVIGYRSSGLFCCNSELTDILECGQIGSCYFPVVSELLAETEPVATEVCDTAYEPPPEPEPEQRGCSTVPALGLAWLVAAVVTRRRA